MNLIKVNCELKESERSGHQLKYAVQFPQCRRAKNSKRHGRTYVYVKFTIRVYRPVLLESCSPTVFCRRRWFSIGSDETLLLVLHGSCSVVGHSCYWSIMRLTGTRKVPREDGRSPHRSCNCCCSRKEMEASPVESTSPPFIQVVMWSVQSNHTLPCVPKSPWLV